MSKSKTHIYRPREAYTMKIAKGTDRYVCVDCKTPIGHRDFCARCAWEERLSK